MRPKSRLSTHRERVKWLGHAKPDLLKERVSGSELADAYDLSDGCCHVLGSRPLPFGRPYAGPRQDGEPLVSGMPRSEAVAGAVPGSACHGPLTGNRLR